MDKFNIQFATQRLREEGSVTSTGANFTPGPGEQSAPAKAFKKKVKKEEKDVEPKLAAGKAKVYMKDKWGWEEAPSIPNRPSKGGFIYKQLFEELSKFVNEIDANDPVLMAMRAKKDAPAPQVQKPNRIQVAAKSTINMLLKKRAEIERDMEQEAEPEGGPIADKYGDMLNKIDRAIAKLKGQGDWGPETNPYMDKGEIERRARMMREEPDVYDSLRSTLKQLGAEEDSIKVLVKAVEMGALKPSEVITITKKALNIKEEKVSQINFEPTLEVIKQIADNIGLDWENVLQGDIKMYNDADFQVSNIPNQGITSFSARLSDDESEFIIDVPNSAQTAIPNTIFESLNENYSRFRNETKTRNKPEQFHQAIREVRKKVQEINKLFEYVSRLKQELSEGEGGLKYKTHTEKALAKIKEMVSELNQNIKKFK